jgi:hypothetical protein
VIRSPTTSKREGRHGGLSYCPTRPGGPFHRAFGDVLVRGEITVELELAVVSTDEKR